MSTDRHISDAPIGAAVARAEEETVSDHETTDAVIARAFGPPAGGIPTGDGQAHRTADLEPEDDALTDRLIARQFPGAA